MIPFKQCRGCLRVFYGIFQKSFSCDNIKHSQNYKKFTKRKLFEYRYSTILYKLVLEKKKWLLRATKRNSKCPLWSSSGPSTFGSCLRLVFWDEGNVGSKPISCTSWASKSKAFLLFSRSAESYLWISSGRTLLAILPFCKKFYLFPKVWPNGGREIFIIISWIHHQNIFSILLINAWFPFNMYF